MDIVLDEGYQFGLGVFETIAIERGKPLLLDWHLQRLQASTRALAIEKTVTEEEVYRYLEDKDAPHHALKIMVSVKNLVFTLRQNPYTEASFQKGFALDYSPVYRNETSSLVHHKTMNYGDCILEKRRCKGLGLDELLFLNSRGEVCEGTTTNLFFVRKGKLYTPSVDCGLLPGIMRRWVMEQLSVTEGVFYKEDLLEAEECFVTNSLMGVMPVTELAGKSCVCGPVTAECMQSWVRKVQEK